MLLVVAVDELTVVDFLRAPTAEDAPLAVFKTDADEGLSENFFKLLFRYC